MKKLLALLLACTFVLALLPVSLAAKAPVKLVYAYAGNGMQTDTALVNEAMNEWLHTHEGYEHITIELVPCGGAGNNLATTITLAQASGEQIDICNSYSLSLGNYVADEYVIALDDLLVGTDILTEVPEWLLQLGQYNGTQYFVPNFQNPASIRYLVVPAEYIQYYEGGAEAIRDVWLNPESTVREKLDTVKNLVLAVREGTGLDTKWAQNMIYPHEFINWEGLMSHWIIVKEGTAEAVCTWTEDWFVEALEIMAEWYEDGIVHPDCATYTQADYMNKNALNDEAFVSWFGGGMWYTPDELTTIHQYANGGVDLVAIPVKTNYYTTASWGAGGSWITATCKNPEEAMMIIELLNTEKGAEFYNLLVYGIEDRQYTTNDDGTIKTLEYDGMQGSSSTSYMTPGWMVGNTMNQYVNQGFAANYRELCTSIGVSEDVAHSMIAGLLFDNTAVADQMAQVTAMINEFDSTLRNGLGKTDGWQQYYNELIAKLDAAGIQKVLDHINAQIADYVK